MTAWILQNDDPELDNRVRLHALYCMQTDLDTRRKYPFIKLPDEDYLSSDERDEAVATFGPDPVRLWTGHQSLEELGADVAGQEDDEFVRESIGAWCAMAGHWSRALAQGTGLANWSHRRYTTDDVDGTSQLAVVIGPSHDEIANALHCSSTAFSIATSEVVERFASDLEEGLKAAQGLAWRAWKRPDQLIDLLDNSPCPCDKPGTLWGECHKWTETLGTQSVQFISDADLIHSRPYQASEEEVGTPTVDVSSDPPDLPEGPLILTFTFTVPFTLGLTDSGSHTLVLDSKWVDQNDIANFGASPSVRIRLHNQELVGDEWLPKHAGSALADLYGYSGDNPVESWPPIADSYEQWVTIETPSGRIQSDNPRSRVCTSPWVDLSEPVPNWIAAGVHS